MLKNLQVAVLTVPLGRVLHTCIQVYLWFEAEFRLGTPNIINAATCKKSHTAACQWCAFTLEAGYNGKNIRCEIGKPERNIALRKLFAQSVGNGCGQFANGDGMLTRNIVAAANRFGL